MTNLAANLVRSARRHPDRVAVRLDEQVLRYRDVDETSVLARPLETRP